MAAIAFDTLKFARRMIEAGVSKEQAEAQAEVLAEAFLHNLDQLVTRDYLDARLDARFAEQDVKFTGIEGRFRLMYWMQALIIAAVVIPQLAALLR